MSPSDRRGQPTSVPVQLGRRVQKCYSDRRFQLEVWVSRLDLHRSKELHIVLRVLAVGARRSSQISCTGNEHVNGDADISQSFFYGRNGAKNVLGIAQRFPYR